MEKQKKILIFELNWMGDILFSFPFLRALRERFPGAYIACAVVSRYSELFESNPWINAVYLLNDNNTITSLPEKAAFVKKIRKERYDSCFFLKPSRSKAIAARLCGISERTGFAGKNAPLTAAVEMPAPNTVHRADQLLLLAGAAAKPGEFDRTYEYSPGPDHEQRALRILREAGGGRRRIVSINPGGNWDAKRWPMNSFIELSRSLLSRFDDVEVAVTGSKKDISLADDIIKEANSERCYSVAGKTGLNELAAVFLRSCLVISADSGPLHLASATGTRTIGLFGPTSPDITGPRGKGKNIVISKAHGCVVPCYEEHCGKGYACMASIAPEEVFGQAERCLFEGQNG